MSLVIAGLAAQAAIQGIAGGISLARGLNQRVIDRQDYTADPNVMALRDEANVQKGGRMANAGVLERNIQASGATTADRLRRSSTDASQAFLGASVVGEQQNQAALNLAELERQDAIRREGRADQATLLASQERAREIQDQQLKRQEQIAARTQLISGGLQGLTSAAGGFASIGQLQSSQALQDAQIGLLGAQRNYYTMAGGFPRMAFETGTGTGTSSSVMGQNFLGGGGMTSGFGGLGTNQPMMNIPGFGMRPNPLYKEK